MARSINALLLLGGNTGQPASTLAEAIASIDREVGEVLATSRDHWTEPWGFSDKRLFLNKAVVVRTALEPQRLMDACLSIERTLGRERTEGAGYGPRPIDIDVLLIGDRVIDVPGLQVPHPRLHERLFALAPAADVAPEWVHPMLERTVMELLSALIEQQASAQ